MRTGRHFREVLWIAIVLAAGSAGGCGEDTPDRPRAAAPTATPERSREVPKTTDGVAWTRAQALRRLDGRRIRVDRRVVRLDRSTLTCGGVGRPAKRIGDEDAWTRFRCVQPTFPRGVFAGPDAVFLAEPRSERRAAIVRARFTDY
jgi:hypothetical protein